MNLEKAKRGAVRWRILATLDAGRPGWVSENLLLDVLSDLELSVTHQEVRRELDYLESRQLLEIKGRKEPVWAAKLTRDGIDVVEYTVDVEPGIARPPQQK